MTNNNTPIIIREILARSILSTSKLFDYTINPYTGCQHGCTYCYARFMKRFTGHKEPWGQFVDVKINAPDLLQQEVKRKPPGRVWISGVCDPYQPLEARYQLTKKCLEMLIQHDWPITIQTRSSLVLRDIELLQGVDNVEVGLSVTTADDNVRRIFEPNATPIRTRISALEELHRKGIRTYAMIAPILPGVEELPTLLKGKVNYVLIDKMNYHYADWVYRKYNVKGARNSDFFYQIGKELAASLENHGIEYQVFFLSTLL